MSSQGLLFIFLVLAIMLAVDITRRAIFSIINGSNEQKIRVKMRQLRRPKQPWVTVLVYGKNQAVELERTVRRIRRSRYAAYDIVVVSDRSEDTTTVRMKQYINTTNHQVEIQFLQRRTTGTKMDAYRAAYRKSRHGKIIVCLNAGDQVNQSLLKRAVVLRASKQQWQVSTTVINEPYGLVALVKGLRAMFWHNTTIAQVYTPTALRCNTRIGRRVARSTVVFYTQVLVVGIIAMGIVYGEFIILWYSWVLFSTYLLALIWIQNEIPTSQKLKFSFSVPSALFLIPVVGLTEGVAQLRIRK